MVDDAARARLMATASAIYGDETAEICGLLFGACGGVLESLQVGPKRQCALATLLLAGNDNQQVRRLPEVLEACDLTLECAVRELSPVCAALEAAVGGVLGASESLAARLQLRELKQAFVFNTLLAKKTRDICCHYFGPHASPSLHAPLGFLWLLFCTARAALLPAHGDLVTSFALLLACTSLLLRHVPAHLLRQDQQQQLEQRRGSLDELLTSVAAAHGAADHTATVCQLAGLLQQLLVQVLPQALAGVPASSSLTKEGSQAPCVEWLQFQGLFGADGQVQAAAVDAVQQHYRSLNAGADIDALTFLTPSPAVPRAAHAGSMPPLPPTAKPMQPVQPVQQAARPASAAGSGMAAVAGAPVPASMDVDGLAAAVTETAGQAAPDRDATAAAEGAAGSGSPGSPEGRQMSEAVSSTPLRRSRVAPSRTPPQPFWCSSVDLDAIPPSLTIGGFGGDGLTLPDSSYRTPSPPRQLQGLPQPTPISAAMSSAAWLQATVSALPNGPSQQLQGLLRAAGMGKDAEARLVAAAQGMATAVLPDCTEKLAGPLLALEQSTMAARRSQGLRIYWRVLEALVAAESARTDAGPPAAAALLAAPLFHRCVAACSFECVLSSYHMANLAFPAVLERLHLPAFDLCKAVEPFVHQLPSLPSELKRHMLAVEEKCLESLAWQQHSSLYPSLIAAVGSHAAAADSGALGSADAPAAAAPGHAEGAAAADSRQQQPQQQPQQQALEQQQQQGLPSSSSPPSPARHAIGSTGTSTVCGPVQRSLTPRKRGLGDAADAEMGEAEAAPPAQLRKLDVTAAGPGTATVLKQAPQQAGGGGQGSAATDVELPLSLGSLEPLAGGAARGEPPPSSAAVATATAADAGSAPPAAAAASAGLQHGDRSARSAVCDFLRRVLKLAAIRLADLLSHLDLFPGDPQLLLAEAFTLAQHVAFEQPWLLYGRHLDQVLLCCLYSVCKLHQLGQATFKAIIAAYKQQPQAMADTFTAVSMRPREQTSLRSLKPTATADIISFYNLVFLPHIRPFLERLSENRSLLVQPAASVLPRREVLLPGGAGAGFPSPPSVLLRGLHSTPSQPPWAAFLGEMGAAQLPPAAWRIGGKVTAPLASPQTGQMAALHVADSPGVFGGTRSQPSTPGTSAAIQHTFGLTGMAGRFPPPPLTASAAAASAAAAAAAAAVGTAHEMAVPPQVADAAVQQMFANADSAAAAAAAAVMRHGVSEAAQPPKQPPQNDAQSGGGLLLLPEPEHHPQSLPLLAAVAEATEAAEAAERRELQAAAVSAFSLLPGPAAAHLPAAPPLLPFQAADGQQTPVPAQRAASLPTALQPGPAGQAVAAQQWTPLGQHQAPPPMLSPRLARRVLSMPPGGEAAAGVP